MWDEIYLILPAMLLLQTCLNGLMLWILTVQRPDYNSCQKNIVSLIFNADFTAFFARILRRTCSRQNKIEQMDKNVTIAMHITCFQLMLDLQMNLLKILMIFSTFLPLAVQVLRIDWPQNYLGQKGPCVMRLHWINILKSRGNILQTLPNCSSQNACIVYSHHTMWR